MKATFKGSIIATRTLLPPGEHPDTAKLISLRVTDIPHRLPRRAAFTSSSAGFGVEHPQGRALGTFFTQTPAVLDRLGNT